MKLKQATEALERGERIIAIASGKYLSMRDNEIWVDAEWVIQIPQFIHQYQDEEFAPVLFENNGPV